MLNTDDYDLGDGRWVLRDADNEVLAELREVRARLDALDRVEARDRVV